MPFQSLPVKPGNIAGFTANPKGFVARARSAAEALRMIRKGTVSLKDYERKKLKWHVDVGDVESGSAPLLEGKSSASTISGIVLILPQNTPDVKTQTPIFQKFSEVLNEKNLKWYMDSRPWTAERNALPAGKASAAQAGGIKSIIPRNASDVKGKYEETVKAPSPPEKLPKAFERSLMTGRPPNLPLAVVFSLSRQWLANIYRALEE